MLNKSFRSPLKPGVKRHRGYRNKPQEDAVGYAKIGTSIHFSGQGESWNAKEWYQHSENSLYVALVADGVTTTGGGEKASEIAIQTILKQLAQKPPTSYKPSQLNRDIADAIKDAHQEIYRLAAENPKWSNMSTTLIMAVIVENQLQIAHVGDSRAYLIRNKEIHRLTLDHTWIQDALDDDSLQPNEALTHPNRNVIRNYLGLKSNVEVDHDIIAPYTYHDVKKRKKQESIELEVGDALLLCTDGLTERLKDKTLLDVIIRYQHNPQLAAQQLVKKAVEKEEPDNITALVMVWPSNNPLTRLPPVIRWPVFKVPIGRVLGLIIVITGIVLSTAVVRAITSSDSIGSDIAAYFNAWFSEPTTTETAIPEPTNTLLPTLIPTSVQLVTRTQTGIPMAQTMGLMVTPIATQLPVSTPKPTSTLSASTQAPVQSAIALSASTPTPVQSAIALSTSTPTPTETLSCSRLVRFSSQGTNPDEKKIDIVLSEAPCSLPDGQLYEWRVWKCNSSDGCNDGYKNGSGLEDATESTKKIRNLISNGKTIEISIPNPDWAQGEYKLALVSGKLIINTKGKKDFFVIALLTEIIDVTIGGGSDGEANSAPNREKPQPK